MNAISPVRTARGILYAVAHALTQIHLIARAAEHQQLREEEAARQAERDTVMDQVAIDAYTARNCPCCHGEGPENRSP